MESYLAHHGEKLTRRFDANTYVRLVDAINSHDVGLEGSDRVQMVHSGVGHDGFLVESDQFNAHLGAFERGL